MVWKPWSNESPEEGGEEPVEKLQLASIGLDMELEEGGDESVEELQLATIGDHLTDPGGPGTSVEERCEEAELEATKAPV